jgi:hypothetical protein
MADSTFKVYARIPFGYNSKFRDRGEVFTLINARNDEKLRTLRYILPFSEKEHKEILCDGCGRKFIASSFFEAHKKKRSCDDDSQVPTKLETAELVGADPDKFSMSDDNVKQTATDLSNAI